MGPCFASGQLFEPDGNADLLGSPGVVFLSSVGEMESECERREELLQYRFCQISTIQRTQGGIRS